MTEENVIYLEINGVYFCAAFFDKELKIPSIDTYIFVGMEDDGFLFRDAGNETRFVVVSPESMCGIYDRVALSKWLLEDHSPRHAMTTEYTYKLLGE